MILWATAMAMDPVIGGSVGIELRRAERPMELLFAALDFQLGLLPRNERALQPQIGPRVEGRVNWVGEPQWAIGMAGSLRRPSNVGLGDRGVDLELSVVRRQEGWLLRPGLRMQVYGQQLRIDADLLPGLQSFAISQGPALSRFDCLIGCNEYIKGGL